MAMMMKESDGVCKASLPCPSEEWVAMTLGGNPTVPTREAQVVDTGLEFKVHVCTLCFFLYSSTFVHNFLYLLPRLY